MNNVGDKIMRKTEEILKFRKWHELWDIIWPDGWNDETDKRWDKIWVEIWVEISNSIKLIDR